MKVLLYPHYVSLVSGAQLLTEILHEKGVKVESESWDGRIDSLPTDEPCFVRASSRMSCGWVELAEFCQAHGHLCFYDWHSVGLDGEANGDLRQEVERFLQKARHPAL